jgi:L-ascorbate metabolism protein UlaG (beta-lactamase superfamily)
MLRSTHGLVAFGKVPFAGEISPVSTLPMKAKEYRVGTTFMPRLVLDGTCFLHTGSANFIEEELNGHTCTCDVLFLCVAGWKKRDGYPERIMDLTLPKAVVLFHYDDFSRPHLQGSRTRRMPFLDMPGLARRITSHSPNVDLIIPEIGEPMTF